MILKFMQISFKKIQEITKYYQSVKGNLNQYNFFSVNLEKELSIKYFVEELNSMKN